MPIAPRVGRAIRKRREELGMSQEALAEEAGLHRTYISLVERGRRNISVDALSQIAEALGVYPSRLVADAERAPEEPRSTSESPRPRRRARA